MCISTWHLGSYEGTPLRKFLYFRIYQIASGVFSGICSSQLRTCQNISYATIITIVYYDQSLESNNDMKAQLKELASNEMFKIALFLYMYTSIKEFFK